MGLPLKCFRYREIDIDNPDFMRRANAEISEYIGCWYHGFVLDFIERPTQTFYVKSKNNDMDYIGIRERRRKNTIYLEYSVMCLHSGEEWKYKHFQDAVKKLSKLRKYYSQENLERRGLS